MYFDKLRDIQGFEELWQKLVVAPAPSAPLQLVQHSLEVMQMADVLARQMQLFTKERLHLAVAALLHDNGKNQLPLEVFTRQGRLDDQDIKIIKSHPQKGADMITSSAFGADAYWQTIATVVSQHHEDFNASGYPEDSDRFKGYPGEARGLEIHLHARIIAVADWYIALREPRPYRAGMAQQPALERTLQMSGARLDPEICHALDAVVNKSQV